jgi:hypothetical protein
MKPDDTSASLNSIENGRQMQGKWGEFIFLIREG